MHSHAWLSGACLWLLACGTTAEPTTVQPEPGSAAVVRVPAAEDAIARALSAPGRPADDRERDADRRPAEVLRFLGIAPDMEVADLMAGRGYYSEILARAVGPQGKVYVQNNAFVVHRFAGEALQARLGRPGLEAAVRWDRELESLGFEPGSLDAALIVLFYHDTYWQGVDRAAMNRGIFAALKPGGVFGVIDHHAQPGSGARDVQTLHRVDAELVKQEVLAAGFELEAESELLRHPEDPRTASVFDAALRGKTDRFVYRFRKPAG